MIAGLDIGATTTKGVILEKSKLLYQHSMQTSDIADSSTKTLERLLARIDEKESIGVIAVSGVGSRRMGDSILGLPVRRVDEIKAIGLGGLLLTGKHEGLIVSIGTGTAIVAAYGRGERIFHVGGTGVGGGTLIGLSKRMLGVDNFKVLEDLASRGNASNVDVTVGDIVGGPVGIVPAEATASNFGRLADGASECDIAAGIFNMVSQVIGVLAAMAAKAYSLEEHVVLVGRLARSELVSAITRETAKLFGVTVYVPENCEYCTAVGAAGFASF